MFALNRETRVSISTGFTPGRCAYIFRNESIEYPVSVRAASLLQIFES